MKREEIRAQDTTRFLLAALPIEKGLLQNCNSPLLFVHWMKGKRWPLISSA